MRGIVIKDKRNRAAITTFDDVEIFADAVLI